MDSRNAALVALAVAIMVALVVAWRFDAVATSAPPEQPYELRVVDESGSPIEGAFVDYRDSHDTTNAEGTVLFDLSGPELVVVSAEGMIPDAIVVGTPETPSLTLGLLATEGPGGQRTVMHFGGNFMMGRRYQDPTSPDTPVVDDEESARAVVADIAPLFGLADLVSINFESVVGTLADDDAYPGKRFLLQSPPQTMAALDELGVNVATLGNNHINDWLEAGVASTIRNFESAGIAHPGGGTTADEALQPALIDTGAVRIGVVSMTTVTGDYVNDSLPSATAPVPAAITEEDEWQYEARTFGFGDADDSAYVATSKRRPGAIWELYDGLEAELPPGDAADLWQDIARVYPELQDWVARRGHGGAARYSRSAVEESVAAARASGADLVVVQLHGGFQFAEVSSDFFGRATRAAVDAGADLVIGHHPHVLQGFEIYENTLIAYSLGNFVFDQDFLVTHPSVVLRTVFEGTELLEATLYPVMLANYRPVPVGGYIADRILRQITEASLQDAESIRLPDLRIGSSRTATPVTATVASNQGRGTIVTLNANTTAKLSLAAGTPLALDNTLVRIDDATTGLLIGRDLFGYGDLEDVQADGVVEGGLEWSLPPDSLEINLDSPAGPWTARLNRTAQHLVETTARTAARVSMPAHRWFDETGQPVDGIATYSVRVWAKRVGAGIPFVRVIAYNFDDTDPTREPKSASLETIDIELPLVNDGEWHELWVEVPALPAGTNSALVAVGLAPPESQSGSVWIDGMAVVEWRQADLVPLDSWVAADYIQSSNGRDVTLTVAGS